jgi:hypothetical protein
LNYQTNKQFFSKTVKNFSSKETSGANVDEKNQDRKDATAEKMIHESLTSHKALMDKGKGKTSKLEIWKFAKPYLMSDGKKKIFYLAMASMFLSKGLALGAPY